MLAIGNITLTNWPNVDRLIWTTVTVAVAYGLGLIVNAIVIRRLRSIASKTSGNWDNVVVQELQKRVPLWSVLIGLGVSLTYWTLENPWGQRIAQAIGATAVMSVTMAVAAITVGLLGNVGRGSEHAVRVSGLMRNMVYLVAVTIGALVILRGIDVEITPMLAALGVGGLAVALALQQPLSNLFAALFMTLAHQVRIGDYIRLEGGPEGRIVDQRWDATTLRTLAGNIVIIPNSSLAQAMVTNFDRPTQDVGCSVEFTVGVDADLAEVERLAVAAGRAVMTEVPGGVPDAEVAVRFQAFSDTGIRCVLGARSRQFEDQGLIRHELAKRVHAALRAAGIDLAVLGAPRAKGEGKAS